MKIHLLSDLHLEFSGYTPARNDADVVVLAGDIHVKEKALEWIAASFPNNNIVYVLGNHEFYGAAHPKLIHNMKARAEALGIHILENDCVELGGVAFLGCTLWTDFSLLGDPRLYGQLCQGDMNDYRRIRRSPSYSKLRSIDTAMIHAESRRWLEQQLASLPSEQQRVVVSHHAPHPLSIAAERRQQPLACAYASDLSELLEQQRIDVWLHGHIHHTCDYQVHGVRVTSNPRGYGGEENPSFKEDWLLEI